jgi:hypothetical protein
MGAPPNRPSGLRLSTSASSLVNPSPAPAPIPELIILLVVEALSIQLLCSAYQWVLVQRVERARVTGMVACMGLPTPVLRQLASQEVKVSGWG